MIPAPLRAALALARRPDYIFTYSIICLGALHFGSLDPTGRNPLVVERSTYYS
ncbi:hypothetical protein [Pseudomonas phage PhiPizzaParty]|nr:hypothetical protein [Pseudomonas phage PhiPizzaParty]